jgi:DNA-binding transcriptional regulator YiaG
MENKEQLKHECRKHMQERKATQEAPYHFTDSGLSNVFLAGIKYFVCEVCSQIIKVEIPAVEDLMNALARAVVLKKSPLTGKEVQFLRKRVGIKQTDFAEIISASPEQLSRWENDHNELSGTLDKFIRLAYTFISKDSKLKSLATKVKEEFQKWSTSIHGNGKGERIIAEYNAQHQWNAEAEPMAA